MSVKNSRPALLALLILFGGVAVAPRARAAAVPLSGFQVNTVASGLSVPTSFAFAPDGRIFIAQKSGAVRLVKNGILQPMPVVQILDLNDYGDRGLQGIALDPNFSQNGYLYLAYTFENTPGSNYSGQKTGRIVRLTVNGDTADWNTRLVLVGSVGGDASKPSCNNFDVNADCIVSDSGAHSMGGLRFGPDGKLYAALGDGSGYLTADPNALHAQDIHWLAGKIIRINTDGSAPADNPFYNGNPNDNQSKIWTLGNRNSFRFNWGPDGTMYIGDVGWTLWEELDIGAKGANYGWPCREGFVPTSYNCTPSSTSTDPVYVYDHNTGSASLIGGVVLGNKYPAPYAGSYIFGDYSRSLLQSATLNNDNSLTAVNDFITAADGPVDIQLSPNGTLYYLALNKGQLRSVIYSSANRAPVAVINVNPTQGPSPLLVHFSATNSSDPDGDPLTFSWTFGDGDTGVGSTVDHTYTASSTYTATLTAADNQGAINMAQARVQVGGQGSLDAAPHHVTTTTMPSPTHIGDQTTLTTTVRNDGTASPFIVDIEIYSSNGQKVAQQAFENQIINTGASANFNMQWQPPATGDYTVKVGLFKSGWAGLYEWTDNSLSFSVLARTPSGTSTPPVFNQSTTLSTAQAAVGSPEGITVAVQNTGGAGDALIDLEVYQGGTKVGQQYFDNQHFDAGQSKSFTYPFTPTTAGIYSVSVGIFKPSWTATYDWFNSTATFGASSGSGSTTPPTGTAIYQDALAPGFENWSWNTTTNFADTALVSEGAKSLKVLYNAPWAGLYLHASSDVSTAGKSSLTFAVAGAGASGQQVQVYLYDTSGHQLATRNLSTYILGGIQNGTWKQVSVPLADLGVSGTTIGGIVFQDASGTSGASVNIDNIRLQ